MAKMSKAERKAAKKEQQKEQKSEKEIVERGLGYDADYYVDSDGNEIEAVRTSFVLKPDWYYDMFCANKITHQKDQLVVECPDGKEHAAKDNACALCKNENGEIFLIDDKELKKEWEYVATSSSTCFAMCQK